MSMMWDNCLMPRMPQAIGQGRQAQAIFACGFAGRAAPRMRDRLLRLGAIRHFRSGEFLLREGEHSEHVLILLSGRVKVTSTADNGYTAVLGVYGPGDLVGEIASLDRCPRSATVVAMDPVHARVIDGTVFRGFIESEAGAGVALAQLIASRLRMANRWRLAFAAFPVRRRLALVLLDLEQCDPEKVAVTLARHVEERERTAEELRKFCDTIIKTYQDKDVFDFMSNTDTAVTGY